MKLSEKILKQLIVETLKEQEVVAGLSSALTSDEPAPKPLSDEENEAAEELLQILAGVLGASISAVADKEEPIAELTQHKALGNANRALAKQRRAAADKAKKTTPTARAGRHSIWRGHQLASTDRSSCRRAAERAATAAAQRYSNALRNRHKTGNARSTSGGR